MTVRYDEAMHHAHAGKQYGCRGPNYDDIDWYEENEAKPTAESLETVWNEIRADIEGRELDRDRMIAYPSTQELLIALWEKLVEVDGLTSDDIADIQARRTQVKADHPKG